MFSSLRRGIQLYRSGLQSATSGLATASQAQTFKLTRSMSTTSTTTDVTDPQAAAVKEQERRDAQDSILQYVYPFHSADRSVFDMLYRYQSTSGNEASIQKGSVGGYATTVKSDSVADVHDGAQVNTKWSGSMAVRHDIPVSSLTHLAPALSHGGTGTSYEILTGAYPNLGKGGWPQMIVGSNVNPSVTPPTPLK
jgi:hypothetical protein